MRWPPKVTLGRLLPHARGLGFKPRRGGFPSGAKKEWGLSPKVKVRVLHTAQLDVTDAFEKENVCFEAWHRHIRNDGMVMYMVREYLSAAQELQENSLTAEVCGGHGDVGVAGHGVVRIEESCCMAKSMIIVPSELNQARPSTTSAPATGMTNKGTWNCVLLISSGVDGNRELHSKNCPFPTITGKGFIFVGAIVKREAIRGLWSAISDCISDPEIKQFRRVSLDNPLSAWKIQSSGFKPSNVGRKILGGRGCCGLGCDLVNKVCGELNEVLNVGGVSGLGRSIVISFRRHENGE
nr:hypothetical protein [Tanacetum cinerariifolium]